jgi:hypothetical protein
MDTFTNVATIITWAIFILLLVVLGGGVTYQIWRDIVKEK